MNIYIETYGCAANQSDSEIMAGLLERAGFIVVSRAEIADIIIVNSCAVKETTENKIFHRIRELENKGKRLLIAGCMPEAEYEKLRKITNASVMGTDAVPNIVNTVKKMLEAKTVEDFSRKEKIRLPKIRRNQVIDIIQLSSGCLANCSFCATKFARGRLLSYNPETIKNEVSKAKKAGVKEVWLTSQDCGCYGLDIDTNIAELLKGISAGLSGKCFLRVGMMHPVYIKNLAQDLVEAYKNKHIFKFLHLPVQSGSDKVLKKMGRGHTKQEFIDVVASFRKAIPEITVWTDIIVGFPGETEGDFLQTIDIIEKAQPDFVNISRFSSRPGTASSKSKQIPTEIKKKRSRILSELTNKIALEKNKRWIGWEGEILIDEYNKEKNNWIGRNYAYKPVIVKSKLGLGQYVKVKITDALSTGLLGVEINKNQ